MAHAAADTTFVQFYPTLLPVATNGLFTDYSMFDVRWKVQGAAYATPPDAEITGSGTYSIGGEFAIQQQMQADLSVAGAPPEHFDSGRVIGVDPCAGRTGSRPTGCWTSPG